MDRRSVTMRDIADRLGVSVMTVSAVLGGKSQHVRVSDETRVKVIATAREMQYRPHGVARALRRQRTDIVGLYSGFQFMDPRNPFFATIIGGLQEGCDRNRKDLLLHGVFPGRSVEDIYGELADRRIDGLVLDAPEGDPLVDLLARSDLPVVAIVDPVARIPSVTVDNAGGVGQLVDYLESRGHRRIVFRDWEHSSHVTSVGARREALCELGAKRGLDVSIWSGAQLVSEEDPFFDRWLAAPASARPTAAVCWNDTAAYDLLTQCRKRSVRVPDDLAVAGFDGLPSQFGSDQTLTTIRAPWADVAQTAVDLLARLVCGERIPGETVLPVTLVRGDTA
jgi:DNA-binding LacI/PurR family transcriptional regulator